jgi:hypothetical protein
MPTPCQPHANPMPTPCQPHANPMQPHANPMPTPCQPHANPKPTPSQPQANPMRPHSSGFSAGAPAPTRGGTADSRSTALGSRLSTRGRATRRGGCPVYTHATHCAPHEAVLTPKHSTETTKNPTGAWSEWLSARNSQCTKPKKQSAQCALLVVIPPVWCLFRGQRHRSRGASQSGGGRSAGR